VTLIRVEGGGEKVVISPKRALETARYESVTVGGRKLGNIDFL